MKIIDNELVIETKDSLRFIADQCRGYRFSCIVVPTSRKDEFERSTFYGNIMTGSPAVRFIDDIVQLLMPDSEMDRHNIWLEKHKHGFVNEPLKAEEIHDDLTIDCDDYSGDG